MPRPDSSRKSRKKKPKLSRLAKPADMTLEEWQIELRKQFGKTQSFRVKNLGEHPVFSEFHVFNPESKGVYRVRIRSRRPGENACTCPDFATNTLGTCKHIEFLLGKLGRNRERASLLKGGFQPEFSEVCLEYGAQRTVRFRPGGACSAALARLAGDYFDDDGSLKADAALRFDEFLQRASALDDDLRCDDDVLTFLAEVRDAAERQERIATAFPRGARSAAFKDVLKTPLYDYQREGALFAAKAGRCLIGDEMGLGKTIQALAAAEIMARCLGVERVLVVCPTSLKHQWQREIEKFTGRPVAVVNGFRAQREQAYALSDSFFKVVNYDTVHTDLDLIAGWSPDLVILDEAQRIKNWNTRVARSVKKITSPYAVVLTGTPLENRLEELISIVQFVDRFRLGPTFRLLHEHQKLDAVGKVVGYKNLDRIGETLAPVLIRRQKDQVLDQLPERIDQNIFVPMTPEQWKHHTENKEAVAKIVHKWRRFKFLSEADRRKLMICLQNMRMSCDSTYLLDHSTDSGVKAAEAVTLLGEILERPDTKVVVFSQWLRMHELLVRALKKRRWGHVLFHGGVPGAKRKQLVDRFRDDPDCRVFLSTDAGGVGLNLQFASVVMNMDLPWNPAVLEQRIGRVHRLGQKQPVRVINFVAQGTIEEGMLSVLSFKKSLFAGVLDGGTPNIDFGGSKLKKFMETVDSVTSNLPAPPPAPEARGAIDEFKQPTSRKAADGGSKDTADPWSNLLQAGLAVLSQMTATRPESGGPAPKNLLQRDEATGESFLRLPVPKPEVLEQALGAIGKLLEGLRGR